MKTTLLLLIFLACSSRSFAEGSRQGDSLALVAIYNSTGGSQWNDNTNWLSEQPMSKWRGVIVKENRVTTLDLSSNNLTGEMPVEISELTNLTFLYLFSNQLTGEIPPEIGKLTNLIALFLDNNFLTGSIPEEIGDLQFLTHLNLYANELSGDIPPEIGNLLFLKEFNIMGCNLSGSIPEEIGNLSEMVSLYLNDNKLTGSIPVEIGNLKKLVNLSFAANPLSGELPEEIGALPELLNLFLYDNGLSGDIPAWFKDMANLQVLALNGNDFTGGLENLPSHDMTQVWVSENKFTFEDFENTDINAPTFVYHPQDSVQISADPAGTELHLSVTVGGAGNTYKWFRDNVETGGNSNVLVLSDMGEDLALYRCEITNSIAPLLTIHTRPAKSITSVEDYPGAEAYLFPNPATSAVSFPGENISSLQVYGMTGIEYEVLFSPGTNTADISHLPPGVYHAFIRSGNQILKRMFIKI